VVVIPGPDAAMVLSGSRATKDAIWASAAQPPNTGVGVFQRQLYGRLAARGVRLVLPKAESATRSFRALQSLIRVIGPPYAAALICATPAPLVLRVPVVSFVYDLRWRRTRPFGTRMYRYLDLRRTVARADHIFTISQRTRDHLVGLFPDANDRCTVLHLGPGIVTPADFDDGQAGTVLLAGRTRYKRNEVVAEALARARPDWARHFLCVGVSDAAFRILIDAFGQKACERFEKVNDELMRTIFRRTHVYVTGSVEEGFGLPMVEALTAGCQVVAIRQAVTVEVMGDAAVLLEDGDTTDIARQLQDPGWVPRETRLARSSMFSWDRVTDAVLEVLHRLPPR
jgi:mannosyltransferase